VIEPILVDSSGVRVIKLQVFLLPLSFYFLHELFGCLLSWVYCFLSIVFEGLVVLRVEVRSTEDREDKRSRESLADDSVRFSDGVKDFLFSQLTHLSRHYSTIYNYNARVYSTQVVSPQSA
jgi:hypothetical protein